MTLSRVAALTATIILAALGIFQILLIFGANLGHYAWGGANAVLPIGFRIASVFSIAIYIVFSLIILDRAKLIDFFKNKSISSRGIWFVFGYSALGVLMNTASRSHAERNLMAPVTLFMALLTYIVARQK